jgi:hypothetical protein
MKLRSKHKYKERDPLSILLFKLGEEHNSFCRSRITCFLISEEKLGDSLRSNVGLVSVEGGPKMKQGSIVVSIFIDIS